MFNITTINLPCLFLVFCSLSIVNIPSRALFSGLMATAGALTSSSTSSSVRPTALVTGSTDGIGVTTAKHLAAKGYNVVIHGRDETRIAKAVEAVEKFCKGSNDPGQVVPLPPADISTLRGCQKLVLNVQSLMKERSDLSSLSVLMNNAGVYEERLQKTSDGLEMTFAVNVLAPFVVTSMLLSTLLKQKSRIVIASSISQCGSIKNWDDVAYYNQQQRYSAHIAYSESKLLDAMLCMEMASRLQTNNIGTNHITCNCLDPGTVNTKMLLAGWGRIGIDVKDALDQTWLCTSPEVENVTGEYFVGQSKRRASADAYHPKEREMLWSLLSNLAPDAAKEWDQAMATALTEATVDSK